VLVAARSVATLAPHTLRDLAPPGEAQGALALLPAFQAGLLLALGMTVFSGWRHLLTAFAALLISQVFFLVVVGELADHGVVAHALLVRAWAVAVPVFLTVMMLRAGPFAAGPLEPLRPAVDGPR
jgi:hypothetical protein